MQAVAGLGVIGRRLDLLSRPVLGIRLQWDRAALLPQTVAILFSARLLLRAAAQAADLRATAGQVVEHIRETLQ